ncbi:MAG: type I-B CRISPR-associated protein Cas5b [Synergistales bacterium]|nr:type I-B CRISPR-associated protein Cas5b [Synergistales bacterium]
MAVAFDVQSSMAMFRKGYTTTSSISYPIPPPTALGGLVAAILGIDTGAADHAAKAAYWGRLGGTSVAYRLLRPVRWFRSTLNFTNSKNPQVNPRIQIKHQFLSSPAYRVYVRGGVEEELREHLERGSSIFTPYLGVAYAIAELSYVGAFPCREVEEPSPEVASVLPWLGEGETLPGIDILGSGPVFKEDVPLQMAEDRRLTGYGSVLYCGDPHRRIKLEKRGDSDLAQVGDDTVAWFPAW